MALMGPEQAEVMKGSPIYETYKRIAPRAEDWPLLLTKVGDLLRRDYDYSLSLAAITAQTMLVAADNDSISTVHFAEFFALLGGGKHDAGWDGSSMSAARLAILPGATHYNVLESPLLAPVVIPFLDEPRRPGQMREPLDE
jgi:pimeloyl-ACP methyl ester carboxylesterase